MKGAKKLSKKTTVFLAGAFVLCASAGAFMTGGEQPSVPSKAYNAQAFLNTVSYNDDEFTVALDKTPPTVDDRWVGWGWSKAAYQGRKVALDEGKKGLLITSKQSGSEVNGKSFAFGETMSGEFSVDFRMLAEQSFAHQVDSAIANPYADVQKLTFTFTDVDTGNYFDVVFKASGADTSEKNTPEMSVRVASGASYGHYYEHSDDAEKFPSNATEGDWFNDEGWYTRLDGTSFANTAEQVSEGRFTAGAKSTKFYFDPATMQVKADRYYLADGATIPAGEQYKYENYDYPQSFDGRNLVLRTDHSLVADLDGDPLAETDKLTGFDQYTVKVTFDEVTPNDTVVPDAILEDGTEGEATYDRYAKMYIYALNGVDMTGQALIDRRQDIVIGDTWEDDDHNDDCLIAYATFNNVDYDWSDIEEAGVIISGYEKSYKFKFDMVNKRPDENGKFGMAIYGMPSGDYVVTSYVTYKGRMVTTASEDVRYISNDPDLATLKMSADEKTLFVDEEGRLNINIFDKEVVWESDDESVATVSAHTDKAYATVTAHTVGRANIKATVNGETVVCKIEVKNRSVLANRKLSILGDSISTLDGTSNSTEVNDTLGGNVVWYNDDAFSWYGLSANDLWWKQALAETGMELLVNNSWSGSSVSDSRVWEHGEGSQGYKRCVNLHDNTTDNNEGGVEINPDVIAVYMGTNDFQDEVACNTTFDEAFWQKIEGNGFKPQTFDEAYALMLYTIKTKYTNADVFTMTIPQSQREKPEALRAAYNTAIKAISAQYGCTVIDLAETALSIDSLQHTIAGDGLHPNAKGMDVMTEAFMDGLEKYYGA